MNEYFMIAIMAACGILFAVGGTSNKLWRRICIPAVLGTLYCIQGVTLYWLVAILLGAALSLGYGQTKPYWYKLAVAVLWVLPSLIAGYTHLVIVVPLAWIVMFYLSNNAATQGTWRWKFVEFLTGTLIGITYLAPL